MTAEAENEELRYNNTLFERLNVVKKQVRDGSASCSLSKLFLCPRPLPRGRVSELQHNRNFNILGPHGAVATGQNDYHPLYMSNGLVRNDIRRAARARRSAVALIGFLINPKKYVLVYSDCIALGHISEIADR